jgi:hypothetical protein
LPDIPVRHASSFEDQLGQHSYVWKNNHKYHPKRFDPPGDIMTSEKQITNDCDEKPQPYRKHEDCQDIRKEIGKSEASFEQHREFPRP